MHRRVLFALLLLPAAATPVRAQPVAAEPGPRPPAAAVPTDEQTDASTEPPGPAAVAPTTPDSLFGVAPAPGPTAAEQATTESAATEPAALESSATEPATLESTATAPTASADLADAPPATSLRLGLDLGATYDTNVYANASTLDDLAGLAEVGLDGDWAPSDDVVLKAHYEGDLALYRLERSQRHYGHLLVLTGGVRPTEVLYLSLDAGGEHAFFPSRRSYDFWGGFGRASGRLELGDAATLRLGYRLRSDQFPSYDLDNLSHTAELSFELAMGEHVELKVPASYEAAFYRERFILLADGTPTNEGRTGQNVRSEPRLLFFPTFDGELGLAGLFELNLSNDTFYYQGPFGVADPAVDPSLVRHFDTYWAAGGSLYLRWLLGDALLARVEAGGGYRRFADRPAYDTNNLPTSAKEVDTYIFGSLLLEWRFADALRLRLGYEMVRQWSNDAIWDYDQHRVMAALGTWWES